MQGSLSSIKDVKEWVTDWKYPYWRLFSGTMDNRNMTILESNMANSNITESLNRLDKALKRFSGEYGGTFNILLNEDGNAKNNAGPRANIVLGAGDTPQYLPQRGAYVGATPEDIESRIQKAVEAERKALKAEYEHKAEIAALKMSIEELKEENRSGWTPDRISGFVDTAFKNPIVQLVVAKALGVSGIDMQKIQAIQGTPNTDDTLTPDEEKIEIALENFDNAGIGNTGDILLKLSNFAKSNPDQAKMLLSQI